MNLLHLNTFRLPCRAENFLPLTDVAQLAGPDFEQPPALVLGGGSNLLLLDRMPGLTVHNRLLGILERDGKGRFLVAGGTDWNQFVRYTLEEGFGGLENLVLIPGTVGAAPVQNIGAYGAELSEFVTAVHCHKYGFGTCVLAPEDCNFGYRDSLFKQHPGEYLITAVEFDLSVERPLKLGYGAITGELERRGIADPTPKDVANAVTHIRRSKLPDWFFYGNSGSFFKNPVVPRADHERLLEQHPDCPAYPIDAATVKLAAGWLIDRAGLRGTFHGDVGSYPGQALVLVNRGGATGREVLAFSEHVQTVVYDRFGVWLEREVRVFGELAPSP